MSKAPDYKHYCPNCKVYTEMMRDMKYPLELKCVCDYTIVEVWRGAPIYVRGIVK